MSQMMRLVSDLAYVVFRDSLTDSYFTDEALGQLAKIVPPTEDAYVFENNWPSTFQTTR
jgi:hypothetical protein